MDDIYLGMRPEDREEFKTVGEKTVKQINQMIADGKLKYNRAIELMNKRLILDHGEKRLLLVQEDLRINQ